MGASPRYKVYLEGEYIASVKRPEYGAAICAMYGEGVEIRFGHNPKSVGWREGAETFPASESYDGVAELVYRRERAHTESH